MSVPIVVLASGRGSNFAALWSAIQRRELAAEVTAVISDNAEAPVLRFAQEQGLRAICVPLPEANDAETSNGRRQRHERAILDTLTRTGLPRFLVLAGYCRILGPLLIDEFRAPKGYARITNIHPALLPAFPGLHAYAQAFEHGATVTGATVHLVDEQMDHGPICAQRAFSIAGCNSVAEVEHLGLKIEHQLYPETLSWVLPERFEMTERNRRHCVRPY